jgi:TonB family protein
MRNYLILLIVLFAALQIQAQDSDTTIYVLAEQPPRFPACEKLDTTLAVKQKCAQQTLMAFVYRNVNYPLEARQNGNEGQVVVSFVVEKDGSLSNFQVLKDIGGGCGQAVLNVVGAMNPANIRWVPGINQGDTVRTRFTLPVKFELQEAPPYIISEGDSIYTTVDTPVEFKDGNDGLIAFIDERLEYPESGVDSCLLGAFDVQFLVRPDGSVKILDITDYNNLGFDFWSEVSDAVTSTFGMWKSATYKEREVPSAFDITLNFTPEAEQCKRIVSNYEKALEIADEGLMMYNEGKQAEDEVKQEEGIALMSQAIDLFPNNGNFLLMRGQAYLDMSKYPEACADLTKAQEIALVDWFQGILPVICK